MNRNGCEDCLILAVRRVGDFNKSITCLSDNSYFDAIVYGAFKGKSKNGANTELFSFSKLYYYLNPSANSCSIKDSVLIRPFDGIRKTLNGIYKAAAVCEIIVKTFAGGGEYGPVFKLASEALKCLDLGKDPDYVIIQFLLRYLELSGNVFDPSDCSICGKSENGPRYYSYSSADVVCENCIGPDCQVISEGILRYMRFSMKRDFEKSISIGIDENSKMTLIGVLKRYMEDLIGSSINSMTKGAVL